METGDYELFASDGEIKIVQGDVNASHSSVILDYEKLEVTFDILLVAMIVLTVAAIKWQKIRLYRNIAVVLFILWAIIANKFAFLFLGDLSEVIAGAS